METKELNHLGAALGVPPSNRSEVLAEMDDADRRALAGEILVALLGNRNFTYTDTPFEPLAERSLALAAIIYPLADTGFPAFDDLMVEGRVTCEQAEKIRAAYQRLVDLEILKPIPPPAAAMEGVEAVAGGPRTCANCGHRESDHRSGGLCELCMPAGDQTGFESDCQQFLRSNL